MTPGRAEAYDRHTGRYGPELSGSFATFAAVRPGMRVLDVGCGPGGLTRTVAEIVGPERVAAIDPSEDYAHACRLRVPGADVRDGAAETLPFDDGAFDAVLCQLVVQALDDAPAAAREMHRVAAPGGVVAAVVWDFGGGMPLLDAYWAAAAAVDPTGARAADGDSANQWCSRAGMERLWRDAGLADVETAELSAGADYEDVGDAFFSFAAGVGFSGAFYQSLPEPRREALREEFATPRRSPRPVSPGRPGVGSARARGRLSALHGIAARARAVGGDA